MLIDIENENSHWIFSYNDNQLSSGDFKILMYNQLYNQQHNFAYSTNIKS